MHSVYYFCEKSYILRIFIKKAIYSSDVEVKYLDLTINVQCEEKLYLFRV